MKFEQRTGLTGEIERNISATQVPCHMHGASPNDDRFEYVVTHAGQLAENANEAGGPPAPGAGGATPASHLLASLQNHQTLWLHSRSL